MNLLNTGSSVECVRTGSSGSSTPVGTQGLSFKRRKHINAIWTTHNHLDTPITKTNQTTMKIQYDIVWDSISDTILPAIL